VWCTLGAHCTLSEILSPAYWIAGIKLGIVGHPDHQRLAWQKGIQNARWVSWCGFEGENSFAYGRMRLLAGSKDELGNVDNECCQAENDSS
jgi:hypothetical protein